MEENMIILSGKHSLETMKPVIDDALKKQADFAFARFRQFEKECRVFEGRYGMDTKIFWEKFEKGELGDDLHWFDWYAVARGKDLWEKKYDVLKGISWKE